MDPQALSNIISLVLVVVTGVYVFLTWRIANSNQKMIERLDEQHREEVRPNVFAHLEFRAQVVVGLVIENMGRSPAYDLRVSISDDFLQFAGESGKNLKDMSLFTDPIEWFPPGAKIAVDLSQGFNFDKTDESGNNITPSRFLIELDYKSKFESYCEKCQIDLSPYSNMHISKSTAEEIADLAQQLKKFASR